MTNNYKIRYNIHIVGGYKMKKLLGLLLTFVLVVSGCSNATVKKEKLQIYASFSLIQDLTKKIVGDKADVKLVVENNEEAHDYEISTKKMAEVSKANVVVYNGVGFEAWIDKVKDVAKNTSFIDTSNGIAVLEGGHDHAEGEAHDHHHEYNPHIWMSIKNATVQLKNIKDQLVKIDPDNKTYYEENYEKYAKEFSALEKDYAAKLKDVKRKSIVVTHAAYTYLAKDYGLSEHSITGISPDSEPSLAKLAQLTKLVDDEKVNTIFFDENATSVVSDTLAREAKVKTAILYSLEKIDEKEDYLSLMRKNLDALVKALNE